MSNAVVLSLCLSPLFVLGVAALAYICIGYTAPHAVALRKREAKKSQYMAEFIGYGWNKDEAAIRAEARLSVEATATENVL